MQTTTRVLKPEKDATGRLARRFALGSYLWEPTLSKMERRRLGFRYCFFEQVSSLPVAEVRRLTFGSCTATGREKQMNREEPTGRVGSPCAASTVVPDSRELSREELMQRQREMDMAIAATVNVSGERPRQEASPPRSRRESLTSGSPNAGEPNPGMRSRSNSRLSQRRKGSFSLDSTLNNDDLTPEQAAAAFHARFQPASPTLPVT